MSEKYSRVVQALTDRPWAIRQSTLDLICSVVHQRASGVELTRDEIQARIGTEQNRPTQQIIGTVGVLPVFGVLAQRMNMFVDISGGTSYQCLIKDFRAMRDDPQVKAIIFEHDSPGGEVSGLVEAAEEIFAARETKRLIAVVNPLSASASLFLACACHEIIITPSGQMGCIGTILCHTDHSKQNEMIGIAPTYITSSPHKAETNEDAPLGDEAREYLQAMVDAFGDQFEKFVAKGRGVSVAQVKRDFGGGRMLIARDAVTVGLADKIATMDDTVNRLVGRKVMVGARAALAEGALEIDATSAAMEDITEGIVAETPAPEPVPEPEHLPVPEPAPTPEVEALLARLPMAPIETTESRPIICRKDEAGAISLVGEWPERALFSAALLSNGMESSLRLDGSEIHLTLSNASATYRAVARMHGDTMIQAERVACSPDLWQARDRRRRALELGVV